MHAKVNSTLSCTLRLAVATIVVFAPCAPIAQHLVANPWDSKLKPYVDRLNAGLPTMVARTLRQERVTVFNGVITYTYTDVSRTAAQMAQLNLKDTQRPYIFPAICKAPDTGKMLREGIAFRYLYAGKDGKLAAQLVFLGADCATGR